MYGDAPEYGLAPDPDDVDATEHGLDVDRHLVRLQPGLPSALGLRGVQRVEPILQLSDAESTVASRLPQLLGDAVTIRIRGTHRAVVARLLHDDRP